ncbi:biotin-dependent carboxyltransferase family protein [Jannaschia sp. R86511]|uniref:5-oxoprolinase subunit C family protein n=1 Tax=Jannaschia sp. R86511 TaxID=3093853 RepID=UPI0036D2732E
MRSAPQAVLHVRATGMSTTVQDEGRSGYASWGVTRSGACDRAAYRLANRLVGNRAGAAGLEVLLGGLELACDRPVTLAVTGAPCGGTPLDAPFELLPGRVLRLGAPPVGLRSYVAVRGGIDVTPVLGSRATDTLSGLGPPPLRPGDRLPVGGAVTAMPGVDVAPVHPPPGGPVTVRVTPGPRLDRFGDRAWATLLATERVVGTDSDRVGVRLTGPALDHRAGQDELPSEGVLRGAVQVPPSGTPVVFLADHPVTGGYPVLAYLLDDDRRSDVDRLAQARPGQHVRFRPA